MRCVILGSTMTSQRIDRDAQLLRDRKTLVVHYFPRLKASCGVILASPGSDVIVTSPSYERFEHIEDALEDGGSFCPNCFSSD